MKFKMNNLDWTIKEIKQDEFWKDDKKEKDNNTFFFGRTKYDIQEIWIDENLTKEQKRKILYHELLHCYKGSYIAFCNLDNQEEELWCDLTANSHDIIHDIVEKYFKEVK